MASTDPEEADAPLGWLRLEELDRNVYRGFNVKTALPDRESLFGGQVAAQALRAAAHTVPDGRLPHSLHGYFLRRGDPFRPVVFHVERNRDGRSFSARRVAATQNAEVIFEMSASFHESEPGPEYTPPLPVVMPPEDCTPFTSFADLHVCVEVRLPIPPANPASGREPNLDVLWSRIIVPVESDIDNLCLLAFMSDLGSGFSHLALSHSYAFAPSLDHAMWFHSTLRADEWVLFDQRALKVGGHRGLYVGTAHNQQGTIGAMFTQEMLMRERGADTHPPRSASGEPHR